MLVPILDVPLKNLGVPQIQYVSAGQELERRQRMNYVNTNLDGTGPGSSRAPRPAHMEAAMPGSRINRDGSLRDPELNNEAQSRLAIVQNVSSGFVPLLKAIRSRLGARSTNRGGRGRVAEHGCPGL